MLLRSGNMSLDLTGTMTSSGFKQRRRPKDANAAETLQSIHSRVVKEVVNLDLCVERRTRRHSTHEWWLWSFASTSMDAHGSSQIRPRG